VDCGCMGTARYNECTPHLPARGCGARSGRYASSAERVYTYQALRAPRPTLDSIHSGRTPRALKPARHLPAPPHFEPRGSDSQRLTPAPLAASACHRRVSDPARTQGASHGSRFCLHEAPGAASAFARIRGSRLRAPPGRGCEHGMRALVQGRLRG
ncbi:hypothetical protein DFH09DRAFT_1158049, partial [Mycena vulgaris]